MKPGKPVVEEVWYKIRYPLWDAVARPLRLTRDVIAWDAILYAVKEGVLDSLRRTVSARPRRKHEAR